MCRWGVASWCILWRDVALAGHVVFGVVCPVDSKLVGCSSLFISNFILLTAYGGLGEDGSLYVWSLVAVSLGPGFGGHDVAPYSERSLLIAGRAVTVD